MRWRLAEGLAFDRDALSVAVLDLRLPPIPCQGDHE
jgi:hypothetical protein